MSQLQKNNPEISRLIAQFADEYKEKIRKLGADAVKR